MPALSSSALSSYMSQYANLNADITSSISKIHRWHQLDNRKSNSNWLIKLKGRYVLTCLIFSDDEDDINRHYQGIERHFEEMEELVSFSLQPAKH